MSTKKSQKAHSEDKEISINELCINKNIHPTDETDLKNGSKILIIARPGAGKSHLIKNLLYKKKHILPAGVFFSGSEGSNHDYEKYIPKIFIHDAPSVDNLTPLYNFKRRQNLATNILEPLGFNPWCACVFDDSTSDIKYLKKSIVGEMYKNGRHWRQFNVTATQYAIDFPSNIRGAVDGTFILTEPKRNLREKLYENYCSSLDSFSEFNDLMDQLTEDHTAIYINNRASSNHIDDNIFYYRADNSVIPDDWKFGCSEYWDFHKERFNDKASTF